MTTQEFKEEVLSSEFAPDNFEQIYDKFVQYQKLALKTLKEVHRLCEENGIRYQLAFGSLLGAIRDGGQIPWDYDVDIIIPYEDKCKMVKALRENLSKDFFAWCPEIDERCGHTLMRITPVGYDSDAIHVDVFYAIGVPDDPIQQKEFIAPIGKLYHTRSVKKMNILKKARGNWKSVIKLLIEKMRYSSISCNRAEKEFYNRCNKFKMNETTYCIPATNSAGKYIFNTNHFWDTELIDLSEGTFRVTKYYDEVLKIIYKDYMKVPALKSRIEEVLVHYKELTKFGKQKNNK